MWHGHKPRRVFSSAGRTTSPMWKLRGGLNQFCLSFRCWSYSFIHLHQNTSDRYWTWYTLNQEYCLQWFHFTCENWQPFIVQPLISNQCIQYLPFCPNTAFPCATMKRGEPGKEFGRLSYARHFLWSRYNLTSSWNCNNLNSCCWLNLPGWMALSAIKAFAFHWSRVNWKSLTIIY